MEKRKIILLDILICLFVIYCTYFFSLNFFEYKYSVTGEVSLKQTLQNPIYAIFIGGQYTGGGSFMIHEVMTRFIYFLSFIVYGLLIFGVFRYYKTKKKKITILVFSLMVYFWVTLSHITLFFFNKCWLEIYDTTSFYLSKYAPLEKYDLILIFLRLLVVLIILLFTINLLLENQKINKIETINNYPLKWMRGFHNLTDRVILIFLGSNSLLWFYVNSHLYFNVPPDALSPNTVYQVGLVFLEFSLLISYFFTEWLFKLSPAKVLTGTIVVVEESENTSNNFKNILLRTLVRAIPLESLSFFSNQGLHDRLSKTTLIYNQSENWMLRQIRIVKVAFYFYLTLGIWLFIATTIQHSFTWYIIEKTEQLPALLCFLLFPFMAILITSWISSVASYVQSIILGERIEQINDFIQITSWCIPIMHLILPSKSLNNIQEDLEKAGDYNFNISEATLINFQKKSKMFARRFSISYSLILLSFVFYYLAEWKREDMIAFITFSIGIIYLSIAVISFGKTVSNLTVELERSTLFDFDLDN